MPPMHHFIPPSPPHTLNMVANTPQVTSRIHPKSLRSRCFQSLRHPPPSPPYDNHPPTHDPEDASEFLHNNPPPSPRYNNPSYTHDHPAPLNEDGNITDAPPLSPPQQQLTLYPSEPVPITGYHDPIFCRSPTPHPPPQMQ